MKYLALDFEYNGTKNGRLNLVSVALTKGGKNYSMWLEGDKYAHYSLRDLLLSIRDTHTLLAFNVDAEGRALISLGLDPIKFKWIDLQAEWKMLTNHNDKLGYGKQFIDGRFKTTYRRAYGDEDDKRPHDKTPINLLGCTYKLLGKGSEEDYHYKNKMRDRILKGKPFTTEEKDQILAYCKGDIADLYDIYQAQVKEYSKLYSRREMENLYNEQIWRGETVARGAVIAATGYPVVRKEVVNFTKNIPAIVKDCQEDINKQFPDMEIFYWNKKEKRYSLNTKAVKIWIKNSVYRDRWPRTPKKDFSLKIEAWEKFFNYRHNFPKDNFPAQFLRYRRLEKSLNGFKPKSVTAKNRQTFFSYYGDDDRAHPYLNAYGAQSGRYQPKALGFIHLKAAWMRSLVHPKPGRVICSIDYASQEFLLAALMSLCPNMIEAYKSGDVYLYFAKLAGAVPWEGKKSDYKKERNRFKSTTLGISYQMGAGALAAKLTADTGEPHTFEDAQELIFKFYDAYPEYEAWIENNEEEYEEVGKLRLPDGWTMFGSNDNRRSVGNMPIQGMGSAILRKAIQLCQDQGLEVIIPLHDALYIEFDAPYMDNIDVFADAMRSAFAYYFKGKTADLAYDLIRLDIACWGPDLGEGEFTTSRGNRFKTQQRYIDERSEQEFEQFSKYMFGGTG